MRVKRFDYSKMDQVLITPQGYLRAPTFATRVGVFKYRRPDGSVLRELRPPEEVFKADSMLSLANIPVTMDHPEVMLDAENTDQFMVGFTGEAEKRDKFLATHVTITKKSAIKDVKAGKKEVSCGYHADLDATPGTWEGEEYDVVQRNIVYNHLAVVDMGRAGPEVRIRMDSADAVLAGDEPEMKKENQVKAKISLAGKEFEGSEELKAAVESHLDSVGKDVEKAKEAAAEAQKKLDALQGQFDATKEELAKAKADLDAAKGQHKDAAEIEKLVSERVKSRSKVIAVAEKVLTSDVKFDEMSDREIKEAVIKAGSPSAELKDKSEDYVSARFDTMAESLDSGSAQKLGAAKTDDSGKTIETPDASRQKMMDTYRDAWKTPLTASKK